MDSELFDEELDGYIVDSKGRDRGPVLPFSPLSLVDITEQDIKQRSADVFEVLDHSGNRTVRTFKKVIRFLDEVIASEDRVEKWGLSFCKNGDEVDREKVENYNRHLLLFLQTGVITPFLYDVFPDNGLRRYCLCRTIMGEHQEIPVEFYDNSKKEFEDRREEKEKFGLLTELEPMTVVKQVRDLCSKIISSKQEVKKLRMGNIQDMEDFVYPLIKISKEESLLLKYFAHKFEPFLTLDEENLKGLYRSVEKRKSTHRGRGGPEVRVNPGEVRESLISDGEVLTSRQREVLELRYGSRDGTVKTLDIVGMRLGVSRQAVCCAERMALMRLGLIH